MDLPDVLAARNGIVCAIGAGGKKTTLYALAAEHPGRVGLTSTVFMTAFSRRLDAHRLVTDEADIAAAVDRAAAHHARIAWARPSHKPGRMAGIPPEMVAPCHRAGRFEVTLVKADGARMRALKAPADDEPVVPAEATTVLVLVSAAVLGQALTEDIAHRPERITEVTGLQAGEPVTPEVVARLLAARDGLMRNIPDGACVIPVINAVDDDRRERAARAVAAGALGASDRFDRIVLTSHRPRTRVVAVLDRD